MKELVFVNNNNEVVNEEALVIDAGVREKYMDRVEVLEKVKGLMLLPGIELATTQQVADFYGVKKITINKITERYYEELESDGYKKIKGGDLVDDIMSQTKIERKQGYTLVNGDIKIPKNKLGVFTKRSILRVGMVLRYSEVAKEVRTQLLNITEKAPDEVKVYDINEELAIQQELGMAMMSGDTVKMAEATRKLADFKNRHIIKLEEKISEDKPKVEYFDKVLDSNSGYTPTQIGKMFGLSARKLNTILKNVGVQYKVSGQWVLKQEFAGRGYTKSITVLYGVDKEFSTMETRWTESGRKFIIDTMIGLGHKLDPKKEQQLDLTFNPILLN